MANKPSLFYDRVRETTTTTGTGTLTLAGAVAGFQSFAAVGNGNTCYYGLQAIDSSGVPTGDWEVGIGTYTTSGTTLSRDTILASSNSGSAVSLSAGTKDVFIPAGPAFLFNRFGTSLFDHYASVGNTHTDGTEDDLYSDTLPANTFLQNGDKVAAEYGGTFVSSATATRRIKVYFAGTAILDTGALTLTLSSAWTVYVTLVRVSATVVRYMVSLATEGAALAAYTAVGELTGLTLSGTNVLKIIGAAASTGAASNDVVALVGDVIRLPAA